MTATTRKIKIPDGSGGWKEIEGELLPGATADAQKQAEGMRQQFISEAAPVTEKLLQFDRVLILDRGLSKEHRAFAAALYCVNLRETYPGEDGKTPDPTAFDAIAQMAAEYYDENVPKRKKK